MYCRCASIFLHWKQQSDYEQTNRKNHVGLLGSPHDSLRHIAVPFVAFRPAKGHVSPAERP